MAGSEPERRVADSPVFSLLRSYWLVSLMSVSIASRKNVSLLRVRHAQRHAQMHGTAQMNCKNGPRARAPHLRRKALISLRTIRT